VTSNEAHTAPSEISASNGSIGRIVGRANRSNFATLLGVGLVVGGVAGAVAARRSHSDDDVISGKVSIDLLKKIELLTIRLNLHRS
jgi:hypothetical protein